MSSHPREHRPVTAMDWAALALGDHSALRTGAPLRAPVYRGAGAPAPAESLSEPLITAPGPAIEDFPSLMDAVAPPPATTASGYKRIPESERVQAAVEAACVAAEARMGKNAEGIVSCLRFSAPAIGVGWRVLFVLVKLYVWLFKVGYWVYERLPKALARFIFGLTLAMFGGTYVVTLAAVEGFHKLGGAKLWGEIVYIYEQVLIVEAASTKDDDRDEDADGIADVDQIAPHELLRRKTVVAMEAITEPDRLQTAVGAFWTAYLAVLASLKVMFARTVALALGIAEMLNLPCTRVLAPVIALCLGPKTKHWAPTIVSSMINVIAIIFAWYIQMVISAFYSGLRGGRIAGNAFVDLVSFTKVGRKLMCQPAEGPLDLDATYMDEVVMAVVAAGGFSFQIYYFFQPPFPFDWVLLPVTILEWFLRWQVTHLSDTSDALKG